MIHCLQILAALDRAAVASKLEACVRIADILPPPRDIVERSAPKSGEFGKVQGTTLEPDDGQWCCHFVQVV